MKNLENYGVLEMDAGEIKDVDGGWWQAAFAIATVAVWVYNGRQDIAEGYMEAWD